MLIPNRVLVSVGHLFGVKGAPHSPTCRPSSAYVQTHFKIFTSNDDSRRFFCVSWLYMTFDCDAVRRRLLVQEMVRFVYCPGAIDI